MVNLIVVAGAIVAESRLLIAQRTRPPELAGRWELPGGKVTDGETDAEALARELAEELGVEVEVGAHIGDVELNATTTLRAYAAMLLRGEPEPHDHAALRWVSAGELDDVDWVPADCGFLPALRRLLS
ncbi:(deoxy)nucleoside triphosphate pyrophosphohydrolase [Mycobacterium paraterrae]|uniref:8-oxo-dGTP diphosphatase n=1 Tax=Mycobacterium paraterrae TaxID=577492 RepID=A0ABY3VN31_9MYCO|nr:(deoxy)nucleoside triphosphate pyrophosphohydrolase [Mycobacterium paraterrae]UMB70858.1 (deoxy)nucleoside triphosphate pyrophosphohydrolase [Mycobacterium paraterrae]